MKTTENIFWTFFGEQLVLVRIPGFEQYIEEFVCKVVGVDDIYLFVERKIGEDKIEITGIPHASLIAIKRLVKRDEEKQERGH